MEGKTKDDTKRMAEALQNVDISAIPLHGDLSQSQRDYAMSRFKEKRAQFLICTDVAARGIDVSHVTHVFNMGLPRQSESYVHRIGRTGRAGEVGVAISFITPSQMGELRKIERLTNQRMEPYALPKPNEIKAAKVQNELSKMTSIKEALVEKKDDFNVDGSYELFKDYFQGLSREEVLKLLFAHQFKKGLREIEESLRVQVRKPSAAAPRGRGSRRGPRGGGGSGSERSRKPMRQRRRNDNYRGSAR